MANIPKSDSVQITYSIKNIRELFQNLIKTRHLHQKYFRQLSKYLYRYKIQLTQEIQVRNYERC